MKSQPDSLSKKGLIYSSFLIFTVTFVVFAPSLLNDFVNWDDNLYVYENLNIKKLDVFFFKWVASAVVNANWHPLTLLSHAIDYQIWGLSPWGHHLNNILLHCINTILVYILTLSLLACLPTNRKTIATITALLFGLHPIHVESIAWISERKDLLCGFFYLLSLIYYIKYATSNSKKGQHYLFSIATFLLASMSKPMAVSLPVVLLLLDYYPLVRIDKKAVIKWGPILKEKIPYFLIALALSIVTISAQEADGAINSLQAVPFYDRLLNALNSLKLYFIKTLFPFSLAPLYPFPEKVAIARIEYLGSIVFFLLTTFLSFFYMRKKKIFLTLWIYFLITLLPVLGIVKVGSQALADRYMYLPSIAPVFLMSLLASSLLEKSRAMQKKIALFFLILFFFIFSIRTVSQIGIWRDSVSLWSHEIKLYPAKSPLAYNNRGMAYQLLKEYSSAIEDLSTAITIKPDYAKAYYNRGITNGHLKNYAAAIKDFSSALSIQPNHAETHYNRGISYGSSNDYTSAIEDFSNAISIQADYSEAYNSRGIAYNNIEKYVLALRDYEKVMELNPKDGAAYYNAGLLYIKLQKVEKAATQFRKAAKLGIKQAQLKLEALRKTD